MIAPIEVPAISRRLDAELVEHLADEDVHHAAGAAAAKRKTDTRHPSAWPSPLRIAGKAKGARRASHKLRLICYGQLTAQVSAATFAGEPAPADVAAAEALRPVDRGRPLRRRAPAPRRCRGRCAVTFSTRPPCARIRPFSRRVPAWKISTPGSAAASASPRISEPVAYDAGIAVRRHHHRQRRLVAPAHADLVEHAVDRGVQDGQEIVLQPQHQHLAFGIAEADVVFDELWPLCRRSSARRRARRERRCRARASAATVGRMISAITRSIIASVMIGAGE